MKIKKKKERRCKICGCTDQKACAGGCAWVGSNLCSRCALPEPKAYQALIPTGDF